MRQIFVDSRDKVPGGTSTNFSIVLPQTLALESGHQGRIDDFRLPMTMPTVYHGNSGIYLTIGSTPYEKFIPEGQYNSLPELGNAIRALLQSTTGNWIVTTDVRNLSMAISCTDPSTGAGIPFQFTGGSYMKRLLERAHDYNGSVITSITCRSLAWTFAISAARISRTWIQSDQRARRIACAVFQSPRLTELCRIIPCRLVSFSTSQP
jgi:hypothetical protein